MHIQDKNKITKYNVNCFFYEITNSKVKRWFSIRPVKIKHKIISTIETNGNIYQIPDWVHSFPMKSGGLNLGV